MQSMMSCTSAKTIIQTEITQLSNKRALFIDRWTTNHQGAVFPAVFTYYTPTSIIMPIIFTASSLPLGFLYGACFLLSWGGLQASLVHAIGNRRFNTDKQTKELENLNKLAEGRVPVAEIQRLLNSCSAASKKALLAEMDLFQLEVAQHWLGAKQFQKLTCGMKSFGLTLLMAFNAVLMKEGTELKEEIETLTQIPVMQRHAYFFELLTRRLAPEQLQEVQPLLQNALGRVTLQFSAQELAGKTFELSQAFAMLCDGRLTCALNLRQFPTLSHNFVANEKELQSLERLQKRVLNEPLDAWTFEDWLSDLIFAYKHGETLLRDMLEQELHHREPQLTWEHAVTLSATGQQHNIWLRYWPGYLKAIENIKDIPTHKLRSAWELTKNESLRMVLSVKYRLNGLNWVNLQNISEILTEEEFSRYLSNWEDIWVGAKIEQLYFWQTAERNLSKNMTMLREVCKKYFQESCYIDWVERWGVWGARAIIKKEGLKIIPDPTPALTEILLLTMIAMKKQTYPYEKSLWVCKSKIGRIILKIKRWYVHFRKNDKNYEGLKASAKAAPKFQYRKTSLLSPAEIAKVMCVSTQAFNNSLLRMIAFESFLQTRRLLGEVKWRELGLDNKDLASRLYDTSCKSAQNFQKLLDCPFLADQHAFFMYLFEKLPDVEKERLMEQRFEFKLRPLPGFPELHVRPYTVEHCCEGLVKEILLTNPKAILDGEESEKASFVRFVQRLNGQQVKWKAEEFVEDLAFAGRLNQYRMLDKMEQEIEQVNLTVDDLKLIIRSLNLHFPDSRRVQEYNLRLMKACSVEEMSLDDKLDFALEYGIEFLRELCVKVFRERLQKAPQDALFEKLAETASALELDRLVASADSGFIQQCMHWIHKNPPVFVDRFKIAVAKWVKKQKPDQLVSDYGLSKAGEYLSFAREVTTL